MNKRLALCADDFGLSAAVNRGIEQLAAAGRISDIACSVTGPAWPGKVRRIDARRTRLGLQLNLSDGKPLSPVLAALWPEFPPLSQLVVLAHAKRLPQEALWAEWVAQLAAFEQGAGRAPVHVCSHQHVHHLPQLRELLLELLRARKGLRARHTGRVQGPGFAVQRLLIEGTGGRALGRALDAQQRAQNTQLFGICDAQRGAQRQQVQRWLAALPASGALMLCHPGEADAGDPAGAARAQELAYFSGAAFSDDLAAAGVEIDRP
jgi:chitin disaccharide deacetylase